MGRDRAVFLVAHLHGQGGDPQRSAWLCPLAARERTRTVAHRFIADGDIVVVEAEGDNVTKAGVRYDNDYCLVFRLEDGKIKEIREYCDLALCEGCSGRFRQTRRRAAG